MEKTHFYAKRVKKKSFFEQHWNIFIIFAAWFTIVAIESTYCVGRIVPIRVG